MDLISLTNIWKYFLLPGIIDHHQPDSNFAESCVTSLVVHDADKYISHLKNEH